MLCDLYNKKTTTPTTFTHRHQEVCPVTYFRCKTCVAKGHEARECPRNGYNAGCFRCYLPGSIYIKGGLDIQLHDRDGGFIKCGLPTKHRTHQTRTLVWKLFRMARDELPGGASWEKHVLTDALGAQDFRSLSDLDFYALLNLKTVTAKMNPALKILVGVLDRWYLKA